MRFSYLPFIIAMFSFILITGCSKGLDDNYDKLSEEFPPNMLGAIYIKNQEYKMHSGGYRWERKIGSDTETQQTDHASPIQMAPDIKAIGVDANEPIYIKVEENSNLSLYLWSKDGSEEEVILEDDHFLAPKSEGKYVYEVEAQWENGEIHYVFVIEVK